MKKTKQSINFPLCRYTKFTIDGATKTLASWAVFYKINYGTLYSRLAFLGWDIRVALRRPVNPYNTSKTYRKVWVDDKYMLVPIRSENKNG